jgi:hypothetical protein
MIDWILSKLSALLGVGLIAALALAGVQTVRLSSAQASYSKLETSHAVERASQEQQHTKDVIAARKTEQKLTDDANQNRKAYETSLQSINTRHAAAIDSLRNRPERAAQGAGSGTHVAGASASGTGARLYRDDAEFLVWFAADAAQRAVERDTCYRQYNDARTTLNPGASL